MVKILAIGDLHIKAAKFSFISEFRTKILDIVARESPDFIVLLGDVVHKCSDLESIQHATRLIENFGNHVRTYVLVGNHDMYDKTFLTTEHWMNTLQSPNIVMVDRPIKVGSAIFCPYVEAGRFTEALDTIDDWKESRIIFAHQEFRGATMRGGISLYGDEWHENAPNVVSGHIHGRQTLGKVMYAGSIEQDKPLSIIKIQIDECAEPVIEAISLSSVKKAAAPAAPDDFLNTFRNLILNEGDVFVYCAAARALTDENVNEDDYMFVKIK